MNTILFRLTAVLLHLALCFVPVYAHHGTQFLTKVIEANAAEVKIAELAQTKAQSQRVKDYAQMIVKDHTMALDKMQTLLNDRNAVAKTTVGPKNWHEVKLNTMHQNTWNRLSKLSGTNFDREFMMVMVHDHRNAISDFETHSRSHGNAPSTRQQTSRQKPTTAGQTAPATPDYAMDTDTIAFANEILPTLKEHLKSAQDIQKEIGAGTPVSQR